MPDPIAIAVRRGAFERFAAESVVLLGGGAALLLQLANPAIGIAVSRHSRVRSDPLARLVGTLVFLTAEAFGDDHDRERVRRRVGAAHRPVHGHDPAAGGTYRADDPELQRWVAATLYVAGRAAHARAFGRLPAREVDQVLAGFGRPATALGMPPSMWPRDDAEFRVVWRAGLAAIRVTDEARAIGLGLFDSPATPWPLRPLLPVLRAVSLDLLPESVRTAYGVRGRRRDRFVAELVWAIVVPVMRLAPAPVRRLPARILLARLRRS